MAKSLWTTLKALYLNTVLMYTLPLHSHDHDEVGMRITKHQLLKKISLKPRKVKEVTKAISFNFL